MDLSTEISELNKNKNLINLWNRKKFRISMENFAIHFLRNCY